MMNNMATYTTSGNSEMCVSEISAKSTHTKPASFTYAHFLNRHYLKQCVTLIDMMVIDLSKLISYVYNLIIFVLSFTRW